eukprot:GILJ01005634.1.p1 GENE.GILJ01005634.1~~GILJ01005634.1.p1  ORF type:complete len:263 (-),score=12.45 GILJ01005634.1:116-871(-)
MVPSRRVAGYDFTDIYDAQSSIQMSFRNLTLTHSRMFRNQAASRDRLIWRILNMKNAKARSQKDQQASSIKRAESIAIADLRQTLATTPAFPQSMKELDDLDDGIEKYFRHGPTLEIHSKSSVGRPSSAASIRVPSLRWRMKEEATEEAVPTSLTHRLDYPRPWRPQTAAPKHKRILQTRMYSLPAVLPNSDYPQRPVTPRRQALSNRSEIAQKVIYDEPPKDIFSMVPAQSRRPVPPSTIRTIGSYRTPF